jgi:hypothetical protein
LLSTDEGLLNQILSPLPIAVGQPKGMGEQRIAMLLMQGSQQFDVLIGHLGLGLLLSCYTPVAARRFIPDVSRPQQQRNDDHAGQPAGQHAET